VLLCKLRPPRREELRRGGSDIEHFCGIDAKLLLGEGHLVIAEGRAVDVVGSLLVGRALTDHRREHDDRRTRRVLLRLCNERADTVGIVGVSLENLPAVGAVARRHILGEGELRGTLDGDAVVVVENDQLAQAEVARKELASEVMPSMRQPSPEIA
jgi:hypothetical protein